LHHFSLSVGIKFDHVNNAGFTPVNNTHPAHPNKTSANSKRKPGVLMQIGFRQQVAGVSLFHELRF
jgi:hypothetical protein